MQHACGRATPQGGLSCPYGAIHLLLAPTVILFAFFYEHGGKFGLLEALCEEGAFYQERVVDILAAAQQRFGVALAFGEDDIRLLHCLASFFSQEGKLCACDAVAVVDHREGDANLGPSGRQPQGTGAHAAQHPDRLCSDRHLAWRQLEFYSLGTG